VLTDGRGDRSLEDRRVSACRGARRDRRRPLPTVAAVAELVVVKAACELRLLQVCGDVLVRHLLQASLEEIHFLHRKSQWDARPISPLRTVAGIPALDAYLVLAPSSSSPGGSNLAVFRDAVVVAVHGIRGRGVSDGRGRHLHSGRHGDPSQVPRVPYYCISVVWSSCRTRRYVPRIGKKGRSQEELAELAAQESKGLGLVMDRVRDRGSCVSDAQRKMTGQWWLGELARRKRVPRRKASDRSSNNGSRDKCRTSRVVFQNIEYNNPDYTVQEGYEYFSPGKKKRT